MWSWLHFDCSMGSAPFVFFLGGGRPCSSVDTPASPSPPPPPHTHTHTASACAPGVSPHVLFTELCMRPLCTGTAVHSGATISAKRMGIVRMKEGLFCTGVQHCRCAAPPPPCYVWSMAGANTGGTPWGRSSTCEQRDNCPPFTQ